MYSIQVRNNNNRTIDLTVANEAIYEILLIALNNCTNIESVVCNTFDAFGVYPETSQDAKELESISMAQPIEETKSFFDLNGINSDELETSLDYGVSDLD